MDPPLLDPVVDLLCDDTEMTSQVRDPPLVLPQQVVSESLLHQAQLSQ